MSLAADTVICTAWAPAGPRWAQSRAFALLSFRIPMRNSRVMYCSRAPSDGAGNCIARRAPGGGGCSTCMGDCVLPRANASTPARPTRVRLAWVRGDQRTLGDKRSRCGPFVCVSGVRALAQGPPGPRARSRRCPTARASRAPPPPARSAPARRPAGPDRPGCVRAARRPPACTARRRSTRAARTAPPGGATRSRLTSRFAIITS